MKKATSTTKRAGKANLGADGDPPSKQTSRTRDAIMKKFVVYEDFESDEDEDQLPTRTVNSGRGSKKVDIDSEEESEADRRRSNLLSTDVDGLASEQPQNKPGGRAPRRAQTDVETKALKDKSHGNQARRGSPSYYLLTISSRI
ncbi:hypothetical protein M422DRAFT_262220 [Sphaerobolus stellatus SS14]|uniref:Uncharacterized protein n=1 Tax=Sphaerobolus stellatus (strain SS14) TaxID=990650 RepID=A0A0C9VD34_SPHS4|nr:hypothetical protein M422DRAFT_262220 [Sphaerobolus stellatus SS14]